MSAVQAAVAYALRGYVEMTNDEYHAALGVSKSHLDAIAEKSPKHYWAAYLDPNRVLKQTDAKDFGQAFHAAVLEPDTFESRYVVAPKVDRRTNAGKAEWATFVTENIGRTVIEDEDFSTLLRMRDAVHTHPIAAGLLTGGAAEQSYFAIDPETGEIIKCRMDYLRGSIDGGIACDVKSAHDAGPRAFGRSAGEYRYDIQPPWYFDVLHAEYGVRPRQFVWIAVEKTPPFAIGIYFAEPDRIERARAAARRDFMRILDHKRRNYWPDYGAEIRPLELPTYINR